ncbi:hypothetical protein Trydic_g8129 [Trypoxylus dichotomus]
MWNCCCQPPDNAYEDDCCPDWCSHNKVKGRFGVAFIAETPCCCPEPIGWQIEFCDTPSKVEMLCKEMVQWANCPPLPRCQPCPPMEVRSPCFPPKRNPCCPVSNPCPPTPSCACCQQNRPRGSRTGCCTSNRLMEERSQRKCKCGRHDTRGFMGRE